MRRYLPIFWALGLSALCTQYASAQGAQPIQTLGCILEPSKKVDISSSVAGIIDEVKVKRGDRVKKGQVLFKLQAGVEQEELNLAVINAAFKERIFKRNQSLFEDEILTAHERDQLETDWLIASSELRLRNEVLALRTIKSPVDGVVVNRHSNEGEYVNVEPVLQLATLNPLHVDLLLSSELFGSLQKGQELQVEPLAGEVKIAPAKVSLIDPIIDPASGTFRVQLEMPNKGDKIPAGLNCKVSKVTQ